MKVTVDKVSEWCIYAETFYDVMVLIKKEHMPGDVQEGAALHFFDSAWHRDEGKERERKRQVKGLMNQLFV